VATAACPVNGGAQTTELADFARTILMPRSRRDRPPGGPKAVIAIIKWLLAADAELTATGTPLLTPTGVIYLRELLVTEAPTKERRARRMAAERRLLPHWDAAERRLWLGTTLLKEFRQQAPNQMALLEAFQARGWTERHVSNPLPRQPHETEGEAQERLHDAVKHLNRGMSPGTIHFRGDGSGKGVWWEYTTGAEPPEPSEGSTETAY
jgi:hypothetical protein